MCGLERQPMSSSANRCVTRPSSDSRPEVSRRIPDRHAAHDRGDLPEVCVDDVERHPVPVTQRDLSGRPLVEADQHHLAAHPGDVAERREGDPGLPVHSKRDVGAASERQLRHHVGKGLRRHVDGPGRPQSGRRVRRASVRLSATITCRAPRSATSFCTRLPMKPAPMMTTSSPRRTSASLHRVGRTRQRLGQRDVQRHRRPRTGSTPPSRRRSRRSRGWSPRRRPGHPGRSRRPARPPRRRCRSPRGRGRAGTAPLRRPSHMSSSDAQTPHAATRTRTSSAANDGIGASSTANVRGASSTAIFIDLGPSARWHRRRLHPG